VITLVVGALVLVLVFAVVVAIAKDRGPGPDDVAVSYELAWDRLDFDSVFTLSGKELRDGRDRAAFVAAKHAAYQNQRALSGLVATVAIEELAQGREVAVVVTRVELRDGSIVHNRVELARRNARWEVVAYRLVPTGEDASHPTG
jgi:hypothetical protein